MKIKCPICGAKLESQIICPYCKITVDQIEKASNKMVKECRKNGNKDLIHYTNVIPSDLSRLKIILYTIFFGLIGVNHYYISRPVRATFAVVSTAGSFLLAMLPFMIDITSKVEKSIYNIIFEVIMVMMTINFILWVLDVIAVIFKSFKVPVVLGSKKEKK